MAGFSYQDGGKYNTLARSATFSRSMSLFFKVYINQFAKEKKLSIIYAGGDDVFAIGSWQDIIEFTICLRQRHGLLLGYLYYSYSLHKHGPTLRWQGRLWKYH